MMEYAPGGELFVRLAECGSYTEHEAKPIFAQIASAVQYMVIYIDIDYKLYEVPKNWSHSVMAFIASRHV